ncbi:polyamine ABC transporter substrate-binding protein [Pseudomonas sp. PA1(2017)]|uniref:extracellular solute-binding protein n=1 Tax=Pseudomonas sp. PA1(2017) TaxID=1932113 RepID=UPI0009668FCD|nr:extracellular solute-binding protein [Pseudomonas sp. PA1(2017)]OLU15178.1 polyamine ABC transporter substrate-binding protein [Pseudomonas sp. PA1(2017)]
MKPLICLFVMLVCTSAHAEQVLRFFSWQDSFDPAVIEDFQRNTGIRVEYESFTTAEQLMQAMQSGTAYDVIVPSHFMLNDLTGNGKLAKLDTGRLAHYKQLDPWLLSMLAGQPAAKQHVVPYLWGSVGIVLDKAKAQAAYQEPLPTSWSLLFEPQQVARLLTCGVGLPDAPQEVTSLLLNYKGRNPAVSSPRQISKALQPLASLMPKLAELNNWAYIDALAAGRLCIAMSWSGHALMAIEKNPALSYLIPDEGAAMYIDTLAIPANAPNPELAYRFIDFMITPENAVRNARATRFYAPLPSDSALMQRFANEHPMQVMNATQRRGSYLLESLSDAQKAALDGAWQKLKAARQ